MSDFSPQALLDEAAARTGFADFGEGAFRDPLAVLCRSLDEEAPLTPEGRAMQRERVVGQLSERLLAQEWLRRHPEIADEPVEAPIVIAGLPRTGTTMLYRMLAAAPGIAAPRFYEAAHVAPALDWDFDADRDPRIAIARAQVAAMNAAMPELASIYPFEAEAPEESIYLYKSSFRSTGEQSSALVPAFDAWFADADKRPAYRDLRRAIQFLQWQRRRAGRFAGERWLLKTPDHLHGLDALLDVFPDARIIQTHRDPIETIPSICSFIHVLHKPSAARDDARDIGEAWCTMFARSMERVAAIRERHPDRFLDVQYRDTVAEPRQVAEAVFDFIGEPLTAEGWAEMERWRDANRREARPAHRYTLEEFGLSEARIERDFGAYRARFIQPVRSDALPTNRWTIGDARVTALFEASAALPAAFLLPAATPEGLAAIDGIGEPFLTATGDVLLWIQAFVVEADGKRIVVDTCMGNDKPRAGGAGDRLQTDFLRRMEAAGFPRETIDIVLCTHLHFDHVGWNTMLEDGRWVPTFPCARYLIGRAELDHFRAHPQGDDAAILADSIQPLLDAGLVDLVEGEHELCASVRLMPTPGHTPGHVSVAIESAGARAMIGGDIMHSPVQVFRPDWSAFNDQAPARAEETRRAVLEELADAPVLFIGTHFPAPTAGTIRRDGDGYRFVA